MYTLKFKFSNHDLYTGHRELAEGSTDYYKIKKRKITKKEGHFFDL